MYDFRKSVRDMSVLCISFVTAYEKQKIAAWKVDSIIFLEKICDHCCIFDKIPNKIIIETKKTITRRSLSNLKSKNRNSSNIFSSETISSN